MTERRDDSSGAALAAADALHGVAAQLADDASALMQLAYRLARADNQLRAAGRVRIYARAGRSSATQVAAILDDFDARQPAPVIDRLARSRMIEARHRARESQALRTQRHYGPVPENSRPAVLAEACRIRDVFSAAIRVVTEHEDYDGRVYESLQRHLFGWRPMLDVASALHRLGIAEDRPDEPVEVHSER